MTTRIYIDALNGSDALGNGSSGNPYKTLEYFCNNIALKTDGDYTVYLKKGTYEITKENIFGQFISGSLTIVGLGEYTEILQKTGMYINRGGGSTNFTLNISRCRYNILTSLTSNNIMGFNWKWNFYNVVFEYTPNNNYSVFSSATAMTIRNCVKLTNTTCFLRKNSSTISVYDSMGYFTSGYSTTQSDWDKGGNIIGTVGDYEKVLQEGLYKWSINKTLILTNGEYKKWKKTIEEIPETWTDDTVTFVPNMEANSSLGHIAFASSAYSNGNGAYQAFNETSGSYYSSNSKTGYVGIILNTPKKLFRYKITSVNPTGMLPTNFRILGSNDTTDGSNGTWDLLDNRIGIIFSSTTEVKTFELNETTKPYKSYKLFCDNMKNSSYTRWSLGRIELFQPKEKLTDYSPVIPAHWSTVSNTLPNLTQFLEQGMDNLSPLLDRKVTTLEPMPMTNKSEILGVSEKGKVFSKTIDLKKYFDLKQIKVQVK